MAEKTYDGLTLNAQNWEKLSRAVTELSYSLATYPDIKVSCEYEVSGTETKDPAYHNRGLYTISVWVGKIAAFEVEFWQGEGGAVAFNAYDESDEASTTIDDWSPDKVG